VPGARLARFAVRASRDPCFLGYLLLAAQAHHGWSADGLRAHLGVDEEGLVDLALCRAPARRPTAARRREGAMPTITRARLRDLLASYDERGRDAPPQLRALAETCRLADYRLPDGTLVEAEELLVVPRPPPDDEDRDDWPC
jgi:hypothetical protein